MTPVHEALVRRAIAEDLGSGDVTSEATVPQHARALATITQKEPGVLFGLDLAELTFHLLDPDAVVTRLAAEGTWREPGPFLEVRGSARGLLAAERTALNFLQRLSGVATLAARCAAAVEGTGARVLDTRKTTPGLRALEKAAVAAGGATNHRAGLYDAILIKENHVALAGGVAPAVRAARAHAPDLPLEVECRTPDEIDEALSAGADADPARQHDPRPAPGRRRPGRRPGHARGQRRRHPRHAAGARQHRRTIRIDGSHHPLRPRPRHLPHPDPDPRRSPGRREPAADGRRSDRPAA